VNGLVWTGVDELEAELRALGAQLAREGSDQLQAAGDAAFATIGSGYPSRTGDLKKGLTVTHTRTAFGAKALLVNTSPHAIPFEVGTELRVTKAGVSRGSMPPNHVFTRTLNQTRRALKTQQRALLERFGLTVTDDE